MRLSTNEANLATNEINIDELYKPEYNGPGFESSQENLVIEEEKKEEIVDMDEGDSRSNQVDIKIPKTFAS